MNKKLYVGNLSYNTTENDLQKLFEEGTESGTTGEGLGAGSVEKVLVMIDSATQRSRGFGFVTMTSSEYAEQAIKLFNGLNYAGRTLNVAEATEDRGARNNSFGGGGNRRGGGERRGGGGGYQSGNRSGRSSYPKE